MSFATLSSAALLLVALSAGSAAAGSILVLPAAEERLTDSMIALGAPSPDTPSVIALGEPAAEPDPGVEMVEVASIGEAGADEAVPAWIADQIARFEALNATPDRPVRQVGNFRPMVFRGGLKGEAFPAKSAAAPIERLIEPAAPAAAPDHASGQRDAPPEPTRAAPPQPRRSIGEMR